MLEEPSFFLSQNKADVSLDTTGKGFPLCLDSGFGPAADSAARVSQRRDMSLSVGHY